VAKRKKLAAVCRNRHAKKTGEVQRKREKTMKETRESGPGAAIL